MRKLTFEGYLEKYVLSLSSSNSLSVQKLGNEAIINYRLRAPLFLYAMCRGKVDFLLKAVNDEDLHDQYTKLADQYTWQRMLEALETGDESLEKSFHKTYNSFTCRRNMPETHKNSKALMHSRIMHLQNEKKVSNYRIYTDLKLNPGNINSYLKTGDVNKVSRDIARRIVVYLEMHDEMRDQKRSAMC